MGDWLAGRDVAVHQGAPSAELLNARRPAVAPAVDVYDGPTEVQLVADVPGARRDTVWIHCDAQGRLTIHARPLDGEGRLVFGSGAEEDWYTSFQLPETLDGGGAVASLVRGVLTVRIPKRSQPAPKLIPIRTA